MRKISTYVLSIPLVSVTVALKTSVPPCGDMADEVSLALEMVGTVPAACVVLPVAANDETKLL